MADFAATRRGMPIGMGKRSQLRVAISLAAWRSESPYRFSMYDKLSAPGLPPDDQLSH
jgi:hypothetical protein